MPQSDWSVTWLAVGAISLALMALLQVGAVIALLMAVKEAIKTLRGVQTQVQPLIDRGQTLVTQATDVVHQVQGVVSSAAVQMKRVEDAVTVASAGVSDVRTSVSRVTSQVNGTVAGVRAFWDVIRSRARGGLRRDDDHSRDASTEWETGLS